MAMLWQAAVETRDHEQIKTLVAQGIDVDRPLQDGRTALMLVAMTGDKPLVRVLVKAGANVNLKDNLGNSALVLAAHTEQISIYEYLDILSDPAERQRAAQIIASQPKEPTPQDQVNTLVVAAAQGDPEQVKSLLEEGVNINGVSNRLVNKGQTPLYAAVRNGHIVIVQKLLESGAEANCIVEKDDRWAGLERSCPKCDTVFTSAQDYGQCPNCAHKFYASAPFYDPKARTKILDDAIIDESQPGISSITVTPRTIQNYKSPARPEPAWHNYTPLMVAVRMGYAESVKLLIEAGATLEPRNSYERSVLHMAVEAGQHEIISHLLAGGAVTNRFEGGTEQERTPLMVAVANRDLHSIELLLDAGANVNARGQFGNCALFLAAEMHDEAIITRLRSAGADGDGLVAIALRAAAKTGDIDRVRDLLNQGVDPNSRDYHHNTALITAAHKGHTRVVQVLLEAGADPNLDDKSNTPLAAATYHGHTEVVKILIGYGADVNWSNWAYKRPLTVAQRNNYEKIVELLLAAGALPDPDEEDDDHDDWDE